MEIKFWIDGEKKEKVDPKLFSDHAEKLAIKLAEDHEKGRGSVNKRTQIRKFYDEVVRLDTTAKTRKDEWEFILPQVHMLAAKAAYARGRKLVSDDFLNFIKSSIDQVEIQKDLTIFTSFFEAMMGYYRLHGPNN